MKNKNTPNVPSRCLIGLLFLCMFASVPTYMNAQQVLPQGDLYEHYYRLLQISGVVEDRSSFQIRPFVPTNNITGPQPWKNVAEDGKTNVSDKGKRYSIHYFEPVWFQSFNTNLPRGGQDGAIWQGKGYNINFSTGVYFHYGPFHLTFRPQLGIAQNRSFDTGPYSPPMIRTYYLRSRADEFAYPSFRGMIDQPVRFGPDSYSWADLGDSSAEIRVSDFSLSLSNQRIWSGPGVHNSLQYGFNGPGFLHFRLGTFRPFETKIGAFEMMYIFGGLRKSDYFHDEVHNVHSVNSLSLTYSPRFAKGLSVGAIRTFIHQYPEDFSAFRTQAAKLFESTVRVGLQDEDNPTGFDPDNQIASVFARWHFPDAGLEFYFEYGRNDHNINLRDFRNHINHHRAYLIGMQKTHTINKDRFLAAGIEIMQSETPRSSLLRGEGYLGGWYTHANQVVGFTNRGQILGSPFGPGANVQMVTADLFDTRGLAGIKLGRIVYHNSRVDQFFNSILAENRTETERREVRNVELVAGVRASLFTIHDFELGASIQHSWILNHHNIEGNDVMNTRFELTVRKQLDGWLR